MFVCGVSLKTQGEKVTPPLIRCHHCFIDLWGTVCRIDRALSLPGLFQSYVCSVFVLSSVSSQNYEWGRRARGRTPAGSAHNLPERSSSANASNISIKGHFSTFSLFFFLPLAGFPVDWKEGQDRHMVLQSFLSLSVELFCSFPSFLSVLIFRFMSTINHPSQWFIMSEI